MYSYDSNGTAQKIIINPLYGKDKTIVEAYGEPCPMDVDCPMRRCSMKRGCPMHCPCCRRFRDCRNSMKTWCMLGIIFLIILALIFISGGCEKSEVKSSMGRCYSMGNPRFGYKF